MAMWARASCSREQAAADVISMTTGTMAIERIVKEIERAMRRRLAPIDMVERRPRWRTQVFTIIVRTDGVR